MRQLQNWNAPQLFAAILAYWALLIIIARVRGRRELQRALERATQGGALPDGSQMRRTKVRAIIHQVPDGLQIEVVDSVNVIALALWVLGPPLALLLIRFFLLH